MTQNECLSTPSHWTHYGTCYVGSNATIQLHGISMGGTPSHSVPEPSTAALFVLSAIAVLAFRAVTKWPARSH